MITLKQAAAWCGGRVLPEYENIEFFGACNDSRKIQPGQLFAALIAERQAARKARNFARADEIRNQLTEMGILLEDTREGVKWKRA